MAASVFRIHEDYDFSSSGVIEDLKRFHHHLEVLDVSRCYEISTTDFGLENELDYAIDQLGAKERKKTLDKS